MNLSLLFFKLLAISVTSAVLVNVTIDDTLGDSDTGAQIMYLPPGGWDYGPSCSRCPATPLVDLNLPFDGTWHDSTSSTQPKDSTGGGLRTATISFHGTAIYIYCIVVNTQINPNGYADLTFIIDGHPMGNFIHTPRGGQILTEHVLVYANSSVPGGDHTLTIQNGRVEGPRSLILLDYIVYSHEQIISPNIVTPPPAKRKNDNVGKIVGGVLGGMAGIALCLLITLWFRQRPSPDWILSPEDGSVQRSWSWLPVRWFPSWREPKQDSPTILNPNFLVRPMMQTQQCTPTPLLSLDPLRPPPVVTVVSRHPILPDPPPHTLQPNCELVPSPVPLDLHAERVEPLPITEWQRRTCMEAEYITPPMTDAEMSSFYEGDSVARPDDAHHPPLRIGPRRFMVMNN